MPVLFVPHGGGPWPWMDQRPLVPDDEKRALAAYLEDIPARLPRRPHAMVVVSAHWEERVPTVLTSPAPPMLYDYSGFPEETYRIRWPAPGAPRVAARVRELLGAAGIATAEDPGRGFDHGTFVPLKVAFPAADVPAIQLSLETNLDPARHLAIGRALAPLRDEDVLVVGSGMSYHNLGDMRRPAERRRERSEPFDAWLREAVVADAGKRDAALTHWEEAPMARVAHPREEHLLPLMVVAGAAGEDRGRVAFQGTFGCAISAAHFGGEVSPS